MISLLITVPVPAQETEVDTPTRDQLIAETESQKEALFRQYQEDTDTLAREYDAAVSKLAAQQPEDYARQKMLLEKKFKQDKKDLLRKFRSENLALEKRGSQLRGHGMSRYEVRSDARRRLDRSRHMNSVIGTREKEIKRGPRGYIKDSQRSHHEPDSRSYTDRTAEKIELMRGRSESIINKGSSRR